MHGNVFTGVNSSQVQMDPEIFAVVTSRCLEGMTVIYSHKIIWNIHTVSSPGNLLYSIRGGRKITVAVIQQISAVEGYVEPGGVSAQQLKS